MNSTTRRDMEKRLTFWSLATTNPYNTLNAEDIAYAMSMAATIQEQLNRWNNERRP